MSEMLVVAPCGVGKTGLMSTHSSRNESDSARSSNNSLFSSPPPRKGNSKRPIVPNTKKKDSDSLPNKKRTAGVSFTVISQTPQSTAPSNYTHIWRVAPPPFPLPVPVSEESVDGIRKSSPGPSVPTLTRVSSRGQPLITPSEEQQQNLLPHLGAGASNKPSFKQKIKSRRPASTVVDLSPPSASTNIANFVKRKQLNSSLSISGTPPLLSDARIPSKRQKIVVEGASGLSVIKHPTLWLPDGNTKIQFGQNQFNLHYSRLTKASPLFSDLFNQDGVNEPDNSGILILERENNVVYVTDTIKVTFKDIETMFEIFEEGLKYDHQDPPFPTIASVLRAATSLKFSALKEWANNHFRDIWKPLVRKGTDSGMDEALMSVTPFIKFHAAESLDLARQIQDHAITKLALYDLCRIGPLPDRVSQADRTTIASARKELQRAWARLAASPSFSFSCSLTSVSIIKDEHPSPPCITDTPATVVVKYLEAVHTSKIYDKFVFDPICGLQALIDLTDVWRSHGYCSACISARREEWQSNKNIIWQQLDNWLGLHYVSS